MSELDPALEEFVRDVAGSVLGADAITRDRPAPAHRGRGVVAAPDDRTDQPVIMKVAREAARPDVDFERTAAAMSLARGCRRTGRRNPRRGRVLPRRTLAVPGAQLPGRDSLAPGPPSTERRRGRLGSSPAGRGSARPAVGRAHRLRRAGPLRSVHRRRPAHRPAPPGCAPAGRAAKPGAVRSGPRSERRAVRRCARRDAVPRRPASRQRDLPARRAAVPSWSGSSTGTRPGPGRPSPTWPGWPSGTT